MCLSARDKTNAIKLQTLLLFQLCCGWRSWTRGSSLDTKRRAGSWQSCVYLRSTDWCKSPVSLIEVNKHSDTNMGANEACTLYLFIHSFSQSVSCAGGEGATPCSCYKQQVGNSQSKTSGCLCSYVVDNSCEAATKTFDRVNNKNEQQLRKQ